MIQRKQTLFLLEIAFLSISLLFIPVQFIISGTEQIPVNLLPLNSGPFVSTAGHFAAIGINALAFIIAIVTIFLFKKRELQVKLCYTLMGLYFILTGMLAFCPFVAETDAMSDIKKNVFGYALLGVMIISAALAARFIKKDIELLKSADRIR